MDKGKLLMWDDIFGPVTGWLLTAFATTLGAPFWFDVLNKIVMIRSTVKPSISDGEQRSLAGQSPRSQQRASPVPGDVGLDADTSTDSCGVGQTGATPDEGLPAAEGGVG